MSLVFDLRMVLVLVLQLARLFLF